MITPALPQKRLVIVGATGMLGGYAHRYELDHPAVEAATAICRTPTGLTHAKLRMCGRGVDGTPDYV
jgi:hypothetical protein